MGNSFSVLWLSFLNLCLIISKARMCSFLNASSVAASQNLQVNSIPRKQLYIIKHKLFILIGLNYSTRWIALTGEQWNAPKIRSNPRRKRQATESTLLSQRKSSRYYSLPKDMKLFLP